MTDDILTQSKLKELLHYDPHTGVFTALTKRANRVNIGDRAGHVDSKGYAVIKIAQKAYKAHRLAWLYMTGAHPQDQIDHINRQRSDNRFSNLREATNSENQRNQKPNRLNTSGHAGVRRAKTTVKGKEYWSWIASIGVEGVKTYLGSFRTKEEAVKVRKQAEIKYGYVKWQS